MKKIRDLSTQQACSPMAAKKDRKFEPGRKLEWIKNDLDYDQSPSSEVVA